MAANAGTKARQIVLNLERVLAIEFMVAMQALDYRKPVKSSPVIEDLRQQYREVVPRLEADRILHHDIEETIRFLRKIKSTL